MSNELAICPSCGGHFRAKVGNHRLKFCCIHCQKRANNYKYDHGTIEGMPCKVIKDSARWRELNDPKLAREKRMARRDAEYAAHAPKVTVEEREFNDSELGMVIRRVETRGQPCIGFHAAALVKHC